MIGITEGFDPVFCKDWEKWASYQPTILISKNFPKVHKHFLGAYPSNIIFHISCTGLSGTIFEPNTPPFDEVLNYINNLNEYQKKHVVLRCDPICPALFDYKGPDFDGEAYKKNVAKILKFGHDHNLRIRISFMDMYNHVWNRLDKYPQIKEHLRKHYGDDMHLPLNVRKDWLEVFKNHNTIELEVCGEPGIPCHGCVSKIDLDILGIELEKEFKGGQRTACSCLALKKELIPVKKVCPHKCLYCYWKQ